MGPWNLALIAYRSAEALASAKEAKSSRGIPPAHGWGSLPSRKRELPRAGNGRGARMCGGFKLTGWSETIARVPERGRASVQRGGTGR
jgi:hypothetical protein